MQLKWVKGVNEYLPDVQILRERVMRVIRETFERFGFDPAETPVLHHTEILSSKYAGGAEILKEMMRVAESEFRGAKRDLSLRYDLTVPFSLLIGINQKSLTLPFKRYEIGKVFRDGPIKRGRRMEFTQCDADMVGAASVVADAELIAIADSVFGALELDAYAEVNHRKLLSAIILEAGVPEAAMPGAILALDKLKKIGRDGVEAELREKGVHETACAKLFEWLGHEGAADEKLGYLESQLSSEPALAALAETRAYLDAMRALKIKMEVRFEPTLARGLEIYTGPVFEFFLKDQNIISSSLGGGGRYDRIIGQFLYPDKPRLHEQFPATGISFGLEPITIALLETRAAGDQAPIHTGVQALVAPIGREMINAALETGAALRKAGVRCEIAHYFVKLKKSLDHANKLNIPFVAIVGEDEAAQSVLALRDMTNSQQETLPPDAAAKRILERCKES
ncbi:ATP phosphoribosyltransferase regulatory subunit [Candidatus Sumerlaeota bacterium]|nr:ATP phosphoribosyltransferase regulatory subunit [Candidatus Sumerlaeota bacterium]